MHPRTPAWLLGAGALCAMLAVVLWTATPAVAQFGLATRTPTVTRTATATATSTRTPTRSATSTPPSARRRATPTPTLPALVILPAPSVKEALVGDVFAPPGVALSLNYPAVFGDRIAFGMINLFDTTIGAVQGEGIESVRFTIIDAGSGESVLTEERAASDRFCAFGGTTPDCAIWDFTAYGFAWPSGAAARSGRYILTATATGTTPGHQGTWTLSFEVRLARDGLQTLDGAVRIRRVTRVADGLRLTVETFGFTPLAQGTHLHIFTDLMDEMEASGPGVEVLEYPAEGEVVAAYGMAEIAVPDVWLAAGARAVCVALAHPDHTILPERGECAPLPANY